MNTLKAATDVTNVLIVEQEIINRMFYGGNSPPFLYLLLAFRFLLLILKSINYMATTPKQKAIELATKFYSIVTGTPVDYIEKNIMIKGSISLVKNDSHFKTAIQISLFHVEDLMKFSHETYESHFNAVIRELKALS